MRCSGYTHSQRSVFLFPSGRGSLDNGASHGQVMYHPEGHEIDPKGIVRDLPFPFCLNVGDTHRPAHTNTEALLCTTFPSMPHVSCPLQSPPKVYRVRETVLKRQVPIFFSLARCERKQTTHAS